MKDRIRHIMEAQHLTQQSFAQLLGISPAQLSGIFKDRTKPTLNIVDAIHQKFPQINLSWLLYGVEPMYVNSEVAQDPSATGSDGSSDASPQIKGMALDFEDEHSGEGQMGVGDASASPTYYNKKRIPTSQVAQGSLFDTPQMPGVNSTLKNRAQEVVKYIDKPQRKITEIRIFYDDQTWETFVPKK